jgi:hypothetical protein
MVIAVPTATPIAMAPAFRRGGPGVIGVCVEKDGSGIGGGTEDTSGSLSTALPSYPALSAKRLNAIIC